MNEPRGPHDALPAEAIEELRIRARRLAQPGESELDTTVRETRVKEAYLGFQLLDEQYALPLDCVRQVIRIRGITTVPGAPGHLIGLTKLRGQVLALVDLRRFWHQGVVGYADNVLAVVVDHGGTQFGVACAALVGLSEFGPGQIQAPPSNLPARVAVCLHGVAGRDLLLLSPERLLEQAGFVVGAVAGRK